MTDAVETTHQEFLPCLTDSLSSCLRWRQRDLDDALAIQLEMLENDPWASAQRTSELMLTHHQLADPQWHSTTTRFAVQ